MAEGAAHTSCGLPYELVRFGVGFILHESGVFRCTWVGSREIYLSVNLIHSGHGTACECRHMSGLASMHTPTFSCFSLVIYWCILHFTTHGHPPFAVKLPRILPVFQQHTGRPSGQHRGAQAGGQ